MRLATVTREHDFRNCTDYTSAATSFSRLWIFLGLLVALGIGTASFAETFIVTTTEDSGTNSLRGAINQANASAGPDTIAFNIPGSGAHLITVQYTMSTSTDTIVIDGYTQPGASPATTLEDAVILIELRSLNPSSSGITFMGSGSTLRGLAVTGFAYGVRLRGNGGHTLEGNNIGIDAAGSSGFGNFVGVLIESGGNTVGGTAPEARNLVSGNSQHGILINTGDWEDEPSPENVFLGNFIGTDASGLVDHGNGGCGIEVLRGADNAIGDGSFEGANTIAYNGTEGVFVEHGVRNAILGNRIYTNGSLGIDLMWDYWDSGPDGPNPNDLGDGDWGANDLQNFPVITSVMGDDGSSIIEGSLNSAPATTYRIEIYFNEAADASDYGEGQTLVGTTDVTTDGNGDGSFSIACPVEITDGTFVSATATDPLNNTSEFSQCVVFGGSTVVTNTNDSGEGSLRNAITTANLSPGRDTISFDIFGAGPHTIRPISPLPFITDQVEIDGYSQPGASPATETSDAVILIEIDGSMVTGDFTHGLLITAGNSTVKGLVVNRFPGFGIGMDGGDGSLIAGNYVGTDTSGENGLGNFGGIGVGYGSQNTIGGQTAAERNVVSGNSEIGVYVFDSGNVVSGNYVGTDVSGLAALGNGTGVLLGSGNVLGGIAEDEKNIISASVSHGVQVIGSQNTIRGNLIGLDVTGNGAIGNGGAGIYVGTQGSAELTRIEQYLEGSIFSSERDKSSRDVQVPAGVPELSQNAIIKNAIYDNGSLGIDLDPPGVNSNDQSDPDGGANDGQNYPVLTSIYYLDESTVVNGQLNSIPNMSFHIEFFYSPTPDPTNHGEGWHYLGYYSAQTDAYGNAPVWLDYPDSLPAGSFVTCTATDESDNSSEFSPCIVWQGSTTVTNTNDSGAGSFRWALFNANASIQTQTISFNIQGTGPFVIRPSTPMPEISMPVHIDGYSQPGASEATDDAPATILIQLDGTMAGEGCSGLRVSAGQSSIEGVAITGFSANGIELRENGGNTIRGSYVGLDPSGTSGDGNAGNGILISGCGNNTLGGASPAERNVVANSGDDGIDISGQSATGNTVQGNYVGTDVTGTSAQSNQGKGISLSGGNNTIGGTTTGSGNVISGNAGDGVYLIGSEAGSNTVQGNLIGTDRTGTIAVGNSGNGMLVRSPDNIVGGAWPGAGNVVSANGEAGINLAFSFATGNRIQGNFIGTDPAAELQLGNGASGVYVRSASNNWIGGDGDEGNYIAHNAEDGVKITQGASENRMLSNMIWDNALLGIDLEGDGITLNDVGDIDPGANDRQNFPVIETAEYDSVGILRVDGYLSSGANETYIIQLFKNSVADTSGYGEGEFYLGQTTVTANGSGEAIFDVAFLVENIQAGSSVTATATAAEGNTSEFCLAVNIAGLGADENILPRTYSLSPNYPNPFRRQTTFRLGLSAAAKVSFKIYNMAGELTRTLADRRMAAGSHTVNWDGRDESGLPLAAGVYFYRAIAGPMEKSGKLVLVK